MLFHAVTALSCDYPEYYWTNKPYTYYQNGAGKVVSVEFASDGSEESVLAAVNGSRTRSLQALRSRDMKHINTSMTGSLIPQIMMKQPPNPGRILPVCFWITARYARGIPRHISISAKRLEWNASM